MIYLQLLKTNQLNKDFLILNSIIIQILIIISIRVKKFCKIPSPLVLGTAYSRRCMYTTHGMILTMKHSLVYLNYLKHMLLKKDGK
ncbi:hypothetical protein COBT_001732 [Conglomerata obtusa]